MSVQDIQTSETGELSKDESLKGQFKISYVILPALVALFIIAYEDFLNNVVILPVMYILKTTHILVLESGTNEYTLFIILLNLILNFASLILIYVMFFKSGLLSKQIENKQYGLPTTIKTYLALFALVIAVGVIFTAIKTMYFSSVPTTSPYSAIFPSTPNYPLLNLVLVVILVCIFAPILEELVFRRILIPLLEGSQFISTPYAIVVSATVFAFIHSESDLLDGSIYFAIVHFTSALILGLGLAAIYATTRNVKYSIFYHSANNTLSMIGTIVLAYFSTSTITTSSTSASLNEVVVMYTLGTFGLIIAGIILLIIALFRMDKVKHPLINQFKSKIDINKMILALASILAIQGTIFIIIPYLEGVFFNTFTIDPLTTVIINLLLYCFTFGFFVVVIRSNLATIIHFGSTQNIQVPPFIEQRYTYYQGPNPYQQGYYPNQPNQPYQLYNPNQQGSYPNQPYQPYNPNQQGPYPNQPYQPYQPYQQGSYPNQPQINNQNFQPQNPTNNQDGKRNCTNCGKQLPSDVKFCPYCGNKLQ